MTTTNLVFLGLLFLLTTNGTICLTQALLLATLLTTTNLCGCNQTTV
jgi:hypothetical protein